MSECGERGCGASAWSYVNLLVMFISDPLSCDARCERPRHSVCQNFWNFLHPSPVPFLMNHSSTLRWGMLHTDHTLCAAAAGSGTRGGCRLALAKTSRGHLKYKRCHHKPTLHNSARGRRRLQAGETAIAETAETRERRGPARPRTAHDLPSSQAEQQA
jgi:hypothetical protein